MAGEDKDLKRAKDKIAPQFFDETIGDWVLAQGSDGAAYFRARGTIAMEAWTDTAPITTFPSNRYGFSIVNDGTADLNFTINDQTRKVKPGEGYSALFEAFTSVTIAATTAYRAEVLR
ncbi:hypothetical protein J7E63_12850 [Bacillus sp. ISL-75]|uniref:hypothetical protein n=1 Tax=Bacillus sp. ISL-75 TaxID=2819137 RepID=UPI001BE9D9D6|nr:hypothetical protein [Bacillus sp. ISL-75]MBT2727827.1 hypothetical protein [Bacillus sp. ISL-75]